MIFSINWLKDYLEGKIPEINNLVEIINLKSFEVESFEKKGSDFLIDIDILSNRAPDCYSYTGLAREISAICPDLKLAPPVLKNNISETLSLNDYLKFSIKTDKVKKASKRLVLNLKIAPSPLWLQEKLKSIGQKPINNLVDITNFVMWETGQPVHAFDFDKINSKEVSILELKKNINLKALDNKEYSLLAGDLVIASNKETLDIAGIKGGNNSGIENTTKNVLLSACNFCPISIRKTSRRLGLITDASRRFENYVSPHKIDLAMSRMSELILEICGGQFSEIFIYEKNLPSNPEIIFAETEIERLIGLKVPQQEVLSIFSKLGIRAEYQGGQYKVIASPFRNDLKIKEDFIEEIIRIYGYHHLKEEESQAIFPLPKNNLEFQFKKIISDYLTFEGFFENYLYSIISDGKIKILKPVSLEKKYLRENLEWGLRKSAEENLKISSQVKIFEFGKVFAEENKEIMEFNHLALISLSKKINEKQKKASYHYLSHLLLNIFDLLNIKFYELQPCPGDFKAKIFINEKLLGIISYDFFEIDFNLLINEATDIKKFKNFSSFPSSEKDVSVFVPSKIESRQVKKLIESCLDKDFLISLELVDVFEKNESAKKSLTYRIKFQAPDKTLDNEFISGQLKKVYSLLEKQADFEIR